MSTFSNLAQVQLVWFGTTDSNFDAALATVEKVIGARPSETLNLLPPQTPVPVRAATFRLPYATIRMQGQTGRFDLVFSPVDQSPTAALEGGRLESFLAWHQPLCGVVFQESIRHAVHVKFKHVAQSGSEAGKLFEKILGANLDLSQHTDLIFQVNKRATVRGLLLNRLLKWETEVIQLVEFNPHLNLQRHVAEQALVSYSCDVNTVPDASEPYAAKAQLAAFAALIEATHDVLKIEYFGDLK